MLTTCWNFDDVRLVTLFKLNSVGTIIYLGVRASNSTLAVSVGAPTIGISLTCWDDCVVAAAAHAWKSLVDKAVNENRRLLLSQMRLVDSKLAHVVWAHSVADMRSYKSWWDRWKLNLTCDEGCVFGTAWNLQYWDVVWTDLWNWVTINLRFAKA